MDSRPVCRAMDISLGIYPQLFDHGFHEMVVEQILRQAASPEKKICLKCFAQNKKVTLFKSVLLVFIFLLIFDDLFHNVSGHFFMHSLVVSFSDLIPT
jgi:hypothetical protein